jgi:hypothetical protein
VGDPNIARRKYDFVRQWRFINHETWQVESGVTETAPNAVVRAAAAPRIAVIAFSTWRSRFSVLRQRPMTSSIIAHVTFDGW